MHASSAWANKLFSILPHEFFFLPSFSLNSTACLLFTSSCHKTEKSWENITSRKGKQWYQRSKCVFFIFFIFACRLFSRNRSTKEMKRGLKEQNVNGNHVKFYQPKPNTAETNDKRIRNVFKWYSMSSLLHILMEFYFFRENCDVG